MNYQKFILLIILVFPLFGKSINRFVRDETNGELLSLVNGFIKDTEIGTSTNQEGYFIIQIMFITLTTVFITHNNILSIILK